MCLDKGYADKPDYRATLLVLLSFFVAIVLRIVGFVDPWIGGTLMAPPVAYAGVRAWEQRSLDEVGINRHGLRGDIRRTWGLVVLVVFSIQIASTMV